jgi:16S rRNA processing protein RimM
MERIIIGKIIRPRGLKGEVKVKPLEDDYFKDLKQIYFENKTIPTKVLSCKFFGDAYYLTLEGVDCVEKAECLRNKNISLINTDIPKLEDNTYYTNDIIGLKVIDDENTDWGNLVDIIQYGAADIFIIEGKYGNWQIPFVNDIVVKIDKDAIHIDKKRFLEVRICE